MGKELRGSVKAYNQAVGSLEHRVLPSARRFTELGVNPKERLKSIKALEESPRDLSSEKTTRNSSPDSLDKPENAD